MTPIGQSPTRDLNPNRAIAIPTGCLTASALRSLANTLDRLLAFHRERGGAAPDTPCLLEVSIEGGKRIFARVTSGDRAFRLELVGGAWIFC